MNILVAYASRLGSTRDIAEHIATRVQSRGAMAAALPVDVVYDLAPYDGFVIGSAVYAGHWLKEATRFVRGHNSTLSTVPVWLFSSGPVGRTATSVEAVAPHEVQELERAVGARDHRVFAGAFDRSTVDGAESGMAERFVAKRFVPEGDFRDWPQIDMWADEIANHLLVTPVGR